MVNCFCYINIGYYQRGKISEEFKNLRNLNPYLFYEGATHGFLHFAFFSVEGTEATEVAIERLQEACGLL